MPYKRGGRHLPKGTRRELAYQRLILLRFHCASRKALLSSLAASIWKKRSPWNEHCVQSVSALFCYDPPASGQNCWGHGLSGRSQLRNSFAFRDRNGKETFAPRVTARPRTTKVQSHSASTPKETCHEDESKMGFITLLHGLVRPLAFRNAYWNHPHSSVPIWRRNGPPLTCKRRQTGGPQPQRIRPPAEINYTSTGARAPPLRAT